jgi:putative GTP pyrophosphokinase
VASLDFEAEKSTFREFYDANRLTLEGALGSFKTLLRSLLASMPEIAVSDVEGRIKDREECLIKFTRKYRTPLESSKTPYEIRDKITYLLGLRIICLYEDDVEKISNLIIEESELIDKTDKISEIEVTENAFGYKGLHLDLKLNDARKGMAEYRLYSGLPFELQIRTVVQDSWSIIDHKIKYKKSIPNNLKRRINTLAALFELADHEFRAIRDATKAEVESPEPTYDEIEAETTADEESVTERKGNVARAEVQRDTPLERRLYTPLNAFNFLRIARHFFPGVDFEPHKVDGFTHEITSLKIGISRGKLNFFLKMNIADVKRYKEECEGAADGVAMNPFTIMRHCLYKGDAATFSPMLTDAARTRFDKWIVEQKHRE